MSLAKVLNILTAVLGTAGASFLALAWSTMAVAVWASTREQTPFPASADASRNGAPLATLPAIDRKDAGALYETYGVEATSTCDAAADDYIRNSAKGDFKWAESSLFGARFDKYQEIVTQPGVITLSTDKLILANKSGPSPRVTFFCRYDTQTRKVLGYEIGQ